MFFWASLASGESLLLPAGGSRTLAVPGLQRIAVSDGKVVKARAVPPDELYLTGLTMGRAEVTAWDGTGKTRVYSVEVADPKLYRSAFEAGPTPVVRVDLEFLELTSAEGTRVGVRWPESWQGEASAAVRGDGGSASASFAASLISARAHLEALVTSGKAKVLSRPRLYVRLGELAKFHSGGEFPVSTSTERDGHRYPRVEWKPFGLSLKVKPQSVDGIHLSSEIEVDVSETDPSLTVDGVPSLTRRELTTKMESNEGETVLLSGLIRRVRSQVREGVPILAGIPLLGLLFSRQRDSESESELVIALSLSFRTRAEQEREWDAARERMERGKP